MSVITILSRLVNGVQRNVDLSTNTLKVDILQALTKVRLGSDTVFTDITKAGYDALGDHVASTSNPHAVTKSQVGLGNVTDNAQVKGLASGTTSGNFVVFGADGYTVADSGSTAASFLAVGAKAADSELLDNHDSTYFATSTHDHNSTYLGIGAKAADSELLDNHDSTYFSVAGHNHDSAYLGIGAKAADSDLLDNHDSTYFATDSALTGHTGSTSNPHSVTKSQVGLSNVTNDAQLPLAGGTLTGALILAADPTVALGAATKQYVDGLVQGLDVHQEVKLKTDPTDLPAFTAAGANATKTLTADANGPFPVLQSYQMVANDAIMIVDSPATVDDGIYYLFDAGSAGTPWIMKRRPLEDGTPSSEVKPGDFFFVAGGTFASTGWVVSAAGDLDTDGEIDIDGGDKFTVTQFSGAGTYSADGNGIESSGGIFSLELDGTTLSKSGTGLKVNSIADAQIAAAAGIVDTKLATISTANKVSGSAVQLMSTGGLQDSTGLAIKLDGTTLSLSGSGIKVNSIADGQIASGAAIAVSKLAAGTAAQMLVINGSGVAAYATISGDITIGDTGVTAIGGGKVTNSMLAGSIVDTKLSTISTANKVSGSAVQLLSTGGLQDATGLSIKLDGTTLALSGSGLKASAITNSEIAAAAGIVDTKLATISTANKVSGSAVQLQANKGIEDSVGLGIKLAANSGLTLDANGLAVAGGSSAVMVAGQTFAADTTYLVRFAVTGETAGRVYKADDNASVSDKFYAFGIVQPGAEVLAGADITVISFGSVSLKAGDTNFAAGDIGKAVFLSGTGGFTVTAPVTVDYAVVRVGMVQTVSKIWLQSLQVIGVN